MTLSRDDVVRAVRRGIGSNWESWATICEAITDAIMSLVEAAAQRLRTIPTASGSGSKPKPRRNLIAP